MKTSFTFDTPLTPINIAAIIRACMFKRVKVTIEEAKKIRSLSQNSYYHGVVIPAIVEMFKEAGTPASHDDIHEYLKEHVGKLFKRIELPDGTAKTILGSTKDLETEPFENYLEQIRAWAAHYGCIIPLPNEHLLPTIP